MDHCMVRLHLAHPRTPNKTAIGLCSSMKQCTVFLTVSEDIWQIMKGPANCCLIPTVLLQLRHAMGSTLTYSM